MQDLFDKILSRAENIGLKLDRLEFIYKLRKCNHCCNNNKYNIRAVSVRLRPFIKFIKKLSFNTVISLIKVFL